MLVDGLNDEAEEARRAEAGEEPEVYRRDERKAFSDMGVTTRVVS